MGAGPYPKYGTHTIKVNLQWDKYKGEILLKIGGNCLGASVIGSALSLIEDSGFKPDMQIESNKKHIRVAESGKDEGYPIDYLLYNEAGDVLIIDYTDIADSVVGVQIVEWEADHK